MSKQLFSEFLVSQGVLTADQMADLLIKQTSSMPTVAEIVRSGQLLSGAEIFSAFAYQMRSTSVCDFTGACAALGLWTPTLERGIADAQSRLRLPLVDLLVSSGAIESQKIVALLDLFLSENAVAPAGATPAAPGSDAPAAAVAAGVDEGVANDSSNFQEFYTQDVQNLVMTLAHKWKHDDAETSAALVDKLHGLVGAARFSKLTEIEALFKEAESSVRGARDLPAVGDVLMNALRDDVVFNLEKAWKLRSELSGLQGAA